MSKKKIPSEPLKNGPPKRKPLKSEPPKSQVPKSKPLESEPAESEAPESEPPKKDAAWYITQGLLWVGAPGAFVCCIVLKWLQKILDPEHPLNVRYKEAPVWIPGGILILGPLLGLAFYAIFVKPDKQEE